MDCYKLNPDKSVERTELANFCGSDSDRIVQRDEFPNQTLSTVFLIFNHNYGEGPPLLFETMLFSSKDDGGEILQRHSTYREALEFHNKKSREIIEELKTEIDTPFSEPTPAKQGRRF